MLIATSASEPHVAFLKAGDWANNSLLVVGTKSISISPKQTIEETLAWSHHIYKIVKHFSHFYIYVRFISIYKIIYNYL